MKFDKIKFANPPHAYPTDLFDGQTYEPALDQKRLTGQLLKVYDLMKDETWRSLYQIRELVGGSEAGVSARLRDLRKSKFGAHTVERMRLEYGLFKYRMVEK